MCAVRDLCLKFFIIAAIAVIVFNASQCKECEVKFYNITEDGYVILDDGDKPDAVIVFNLSQGCCGSSEEDYMDLRYTVGSQTETFTPPCPAKNVSPQYCPCVTQRTFSATVNINASLFTVNRRNEADGCIRIMGQVNTTKISLHYPPNAIAYRYTFNKSSKTIDVQFDVIPFNSVISSCLLTSAEDTVVIRLSEQTCKRTKCNSAFGNETKLTVTITNASTYKPGKWNLTLTNNIGKSNFTMFTIPGPPKIITGPRQYRINKTTTIIFVDLQVKTYSGNITGCMVKSSSQGDAQTSPSHLPCEVHQRSNVSLGEVIEINVTIANVTSSKTELWILTVEDVFGSDSIVLPVTALEDNLQLNAQSTNTYIIAAGAFSAAVIVAGVIVLGLGRRYKVLKRRSLSHRCEASLAQRDLLYRGANVSLMVSNDIYQDCEELARTNPHGRSSGSFMVKNSEDEGRDITTFSNDFPMATPAHHKSHDPPLDGKTASDDDGNCPDSESDLYATITDIQS